MILFFFSGFSFKKRGKEKYFENAEHKKELEKNQGPQCTPQSHRPKAVSIEFVNPNEVVFDHNLVL